MPAAPRSTAVRAFDRFFRNPDTGKLAVVQVPNLPLGLYLVAAAVRAVFHPHGRLGTAVSVVATAALVIWAAVEVGWGDSLFRRFLGAAVLVAIVTQLLR